MSKCGKLNLEWVPGAYTSDDTVVNTAAKIADKSGGYLIVQSTALYQRNKQVPKNKKSRR